MILLAQLLVAALLSAAGVTALLRSWRARRTSKNSGRWFWASVALGVLVGAYLSCGPVWSTSTLRFLGAPLTPAVFQRNDDGSWSDHLSPFAGPFMAVNFVVGFFLPNLLVRLARALRSRGIAS
jgi:hypothetical protein